MAYGPIEVLQSFPMNYAKRRQSLLDQLGEGLLIVKTAQSHIRNGDVEHSFRPGSDIHYLTGFEEPDAILIAYRVGKGRHRALLFVQPKDKVKEVWHGRRVGPKATVKRFGVDEAHAIAEFWNQCKEIIPKHQRVFHTLGCDLDFDRKLFQLFSTLAFAQRRSNAPAHPVLQDPRPAIAELRVIKDADEIVLMQEAADLTCRGHVAAMAIARPGINECELQARVESEFRAGGSKRNGYDSIVASGVNACILHYTENDRKTRNGDLVLIDAGAEVGQYSADITRTWPINGVFSPAQKALYSLVLKAEKAAIRAVAPGKPWDAPHKTSLRAITKGLLELGLLKGSLDKLMKKGACRKWFMHGTSHWLGMDVHDVGTYQDAKGKPIKLRPGMVMTVEPGIYIDRLDKSVPKEYRGIGIRIEDDVLVTKTGHRVLTDGVPKDIKSIEAICQGREWD